MNTFPYIDVAVALPVTNTYVYKVPDHFRHIALPGMRALVPFGRRRLTGYILGFQKDSGGYQAKSILDLPDDIPLFPPSMIPLFQWISRYYIHPLGEVIKTALPVGLNRYDVSTLTLTPEGKDALATNALTPREREILHTLKKKGPLPIKGFTSAKNSSGIHALIKKMATQKLIQVATKLKKDQIHMKKEAFYRHEQLAPATVKLSAKRRLLLDLVARNKEIALSELKKEIPTAPKLAKILENQGYIQRFEKQVFRDPLGEPVIPDIPPALTREQKEVVDQVRNKMDQGFHSYLLSGVTGSGKTEVYMRLVSLAEKKGKGAIVLVPEISLITQTERRFRARFGNRIAVLHSKLTKGELLDQWHRILKGDVSIVIGARSAIFAPLESVGIIIVDEEHDASYKQESGLRYNARDLAVVRAKFCDIPVVLGSATPSMQSYYNACQGKFTELKLQKRVNRRPLPEIHMVDLRKYKDFRGTEKIITPELSREIHGCLTRGEQTLIFLNRRGFATFPVCESCGETIKCRFCDVTMTLHKDTDEFRCHLCGFATGMYQKCTHCGASRVKPLGFGTEKIEAMLKTMFPEARVARLDQDTGSKKGATIRILKQVQNRTVDIIVGTQMLAKGHDFPAITLVGIICADMSLNFPDFRSGERTFQLLAQVAGRAGRGDLPGKVIMQTYTPDHFSIEASKNQDFMEFYTREFPFRQALSYPPVSRIIQFKISGINKEKVEKHALMVGQLCQRLIQEKMPSSHAVEMLGPIEAGIPKIALRYRWQLLIKSPSATALNRLVTRMTSDKKAFASKEVKVSIDVDPYFML
ncbi:replication restart DNA helicase PriA [Desulfocicer vacuolatum DSM 3385]|uniref:Replication restart protein PriA n=1 Tax=Desulfocicer vacuolatum DSM 3385 TaxID=1121400 RepID=A0A1W2DNE7_9BACT|nr:primosomal protein N' [Desulfocicer vacuolatum]SMC99024.1 replication restart DNA helicase PriA [Desulfocicer vacuolatum DSM 3385]